MGNHLHEWRYSTRVPYEKFVEDLLSNKTLPYAKSPVVVTFVVNHISFRVLKERPIISCHLLMLFVNNIRSP